MKIAIVHDFLNQYGGAERVIEAMHEIYPDAPIFTSIYLPDNMPEGFKRMDIRTSFMQSLPGLNRYFKSYLMLYPRAVESLRLNGYDVILSSSSAFAKGVQKPAGALHICYCYTPMRFAWDYQRYIEKEGFSPVIKKVLPYFVGKLRHWDMESSGRVDRFVAISNAIQERIRQCYGRESDVIYPPVNVDRFTIAGAPDDYFLVVSRLNAYKRIDLVIEACNQLKLPLKIIGSGPHIDFLKKMSGPTVEFLGKLEEADLIEKISKCRAFIFPGEEDFGIAPLEAQAAGRPVIAFRRGGALETIIEGVSGIFFDDPTGESLVTAMKEFIKKEDAFDPERIRENAFRFDKEKFKKELGEYVSNTVIKHSAARGNL